MNESLDAGHRSLTDASGAGEHQSSFDMPPLLSPSNISDAWLIPFRTTIRPSDQLERILTACAQKVRPIISVNVWPAKNYGTIRLRSSVSSDAAASIVEYLEDEVRQRMELLIEKSFGIYVNTLLADQLNEQPERRKSIAQQLAMKSIDFPDYVMHSIRSKSIEALSENHNQSNSQKAAPEAGSGSGPIEGVIETLAHQQGWSEGLDANAIIAAIKVRADELAIAKERLDQAVMAGRAARISWSKIGDAVGISQQAANSRWNPDVKRNRSEYQRNRSRD